jgi:hypothetical protein
MYDTEFGKELDMPPLREVPPDVSQRLETRLLASVNAPRNRARAPWLAAVAGFVVVAIAATTTALVIQGKTGNGSQVASNPATDRSISIESGAGQIRLSTNINQLNANLDQCWQAAQRSGKAAQYANRTQWQPVLLATNRTGTIAVAAIRIAGVPVFCEIAKTTVTISTPVAPTIFAPDSRTAPLLVTQSGTIAGVIDQTWTGMRVRVTNHNKDRFAGNAVERGGLFVFFSVLPAQGSTVTIERSDGQKLPAILPQAPNPAVIVSDLSSEQGDRSSDRGKLLGTCIAQSQSQTGVPDANSWQPGAMVESNGERLIMATNSTGTAACFQQAKRTAFMAYLTNNSSAGSSMMPVAFGIAPSIGGKALLAGLVPSGTVRMRLTLGAGTVVSADVRESTFAALLPVTSIQAAGQVTATVYGENDRTLYDGPIAN